MGSVYLTDYIDNAGFYLERFLPRAERSALSWREMQEMTSAYRQRGVCAFLLQRATSSFFINMMQSAGAFAYFLQQCPAEQKVTSQAKPYFDALCGGYFDVARTIADGSRGTWHEGAEYREDFLYAWFLMKLLSETEVTLAAIIDELDQAQAGAEPERVQICRALLRKDASLFNEMLVILLTQRRATVEAAIERGAMQEEHWSWLRYFSSEGLALVRLAEHVGIATEQKYLHIPSSLRAPSPHAFNADAWRVVDYTP